VAEGVETEAQCDLLVRLGCDFLQGFLLHPPVPAEELPASLAGRRLRCP
jgi:EAL domain-containing protein (putative c-di-GMP-specific phosphodiesterase class I)